MLVLFDFLYNSFLEYVSGKQWGIKATKLQNFTAWFHTSSCKCFFCKAIMWQDINRYPLVYASHLKLPLKSDSSLLSSNSWTICSLLWQSNKIHSALDFTFVVVLRQQVRFNQETRYRFKWRLLQWGLLYGHSTYGGTENTTEIVKRVQHLGTLQAF